MIRWNSSLKQSPGTASPVRRGARAYSRNNVSAPLQTRWAVVVVFPEQFGPCKRNLQVVEEEVHQRTTVVYRLWYIRWDALNDVGPQPINAF